MRSLYRLVAVAVFVAALTVPGVHDSADATLLWGHPYAMLFDRDNASLNYNTGVVFMWNDLNPVTPYVGLARIRDLATGGFFALGTWESLFQGMMHKKLTYIWTDSGPDTVINDGSAGDLQAFVVTIFGN